MGPKILGCRVGGKPFEQTIESPQSVVESLRTKKIPCFREKRLPLLIGLILARAFHELGNFRIPRKLLLRGEEEADAFLILEIGPKVAGAFDGGLRLAKEFARRLES